MPMKFLPKTSKKNHSSPGEGRVISDQHFHDDISDITDLNYGSMGGASYTNNATSKSSKNKLKKYLPSSIGGGGSASGGPTKGSAATPNARPGVLATKRWKGGGIKPSIQTSLARARSMGAATLSSSRGGSSSAAGGLQTQTAMITQGSHQKVDIETTPLSSSKGSVSSRIKQYEQSKVKNMIKSRGFINRSSPSASPANGVDAKVECPRRSATPSSSTSMCEMEYSSLSSSPLGNFYKNGGNKIGHESITMRTSQQHSKDAVGAAAMAVEYGVGEEHFIGLIDGINNAAAAETAGKGDTSPEGTSNEGKSTPRDASSRFNHPDNRIVNSIHLASRATIQTANSEASSNPLKDVSERTAVSSNKRPSYSTSKTSFAEEDNEEMKILTLPGKQRTCNSGGGRQSPQQQQMALRNIRKASSRKLLVSSPSIRAVSNDVAVSSTSAKGTAKQAIRNDVGNAAASEKPSVSNNAEASADNTKIKQQSRSGSGRDDDYDTHKSTRPGKSIRYGVNGKVATSDPNDEYNRQRNSPKRNQRPQNNTQQPKHRHPFKYSNNDLSQLEMLGQTVQAVHAVLQSVSVPPISSGEGSGQPYKLWDGILHVLPRTHRCRRGSMSSDGECSDIDSHWLGEEEDENGLEFPIRVTCCSKENDQSQQDVIMYGNDTSNDSKYAIELSLKKRKSDSSSHHVAIMWNAHSEDITAALEWVRRKVRRSIKRGLGMSVDGNMLPIVSIRLPSIRDDPRGSMPPHDKDEKAEEAEEHASPVPMAKPIPTTATSSSNNGKAESLKDGSRRIMESSPSMPKVVNVHHVSISSLPPSTLPSGSSEQLHMPDLEQIISLDEYRSFNSASISNDRKPLSSPRKMGLSPQDNNSPAYTASTTKEMTESETSSDGYPSSSHFGNSNTHVVTKGDVMTEESDDVRNQRRCEDDVYKAAMGLTSQKITRSLSNSAGGSSLRLSAEAAEDITPNASHEESISTADGGKEPTAYSAGEIRKMGVMSQKSIRRLSFLGESSSATRKADDLHEQNEDSSRRALMSQTSTPTETELQLDHVPIPMDRCMSRGSIDSRCSSVSWDGLDSMNELDHPPPPADDGGELVPPGVIRNMTRGSMSSYLANSIRRLSISQDQMAVQENAAPVDDVHDDGISRFKSDKSLDKSGKSQGRAHALRLFNMGLMSRKSFKVFEINDLEAAKEIAEKEEQEKRMVRTILRQEHRPEGEGNEENASTNDFEASDVSLDCGEVLSTRSIVNQKEIEQAKVVLLSSNKDEAQSLREQLLRGNPAVEAAQAAFTEKQIEQAKLGLLSEDSLVRLGGIDKANLYKAMQEQSNNSREKDTGREVSGEIRMARMCCLSKNSMDNSRKRQGLKKSLSVSFSDKTPSSPTIGNANGDETVEDVLVFSDNELNNQSQDILTEGQYYLGISMLAYMYSHLRETCRMGHTRVKMTDIDVHSLQSQYRVGSARKYLGATKSAGSLIRVVIYELYDAEDNGGEHDIVGDENKEYEKSITAQFRSWIEDSRVNQLDEETEKMIAEMKRQVARHRWRRAIFAVRLSYKLSGGKRPKFENPVTAPGRENQNRFVDMNAMVSEAMRTQPKYFREGSVMYNLIESGIEMVWFSDISQNDVVYGICVEREEKKVTVVFRGTVNAHNWKMNLKFDTNEYRNPVKQNYPGRVDELSLHSGFALYLLRKRKDTGISKLQEILDKVDEIGREMDPDGNYKLSITGHSLGGALATLCGFYVAARSRFAHLPTIYVWTFAAPRVGTQAFIHAWQHLERTGRIRHARFSVTQDLVPLVPFCNSAELQNLQFYKHVGMRVQLHGLGRIGKWRLQRNLDVTYPLRHDWSSEIRRVFMNNIFANLTTLSGFKTNHKLTEYQKRLHFAMTYRKALGSGVLFSDKRRNRIKSLDEYYHIRAKITSASIAQEILEQSKPSTVQKGMPRSFVLFLVLLLVLAWLFLIHSVSTDVFQSHLPTLECTLNPFVLVTSSLWHVIRLIYDTVFSQAGKATCSHNVKRPAFIGRVDNSNLNSLMKDLATRRANQYMAVQHGHAFLSARDTRINEAGTKLKIFDITSKGLFNLATLIDDGSNPQLNMVVPGDDIQSNMMEFGKNDEARDMAEKARNDGEQITNSF